jgi:hypothetical protein
MAGKTVGQVQAEFKVPAEFAHYRSATRLKNFLRRTNRRDCGAAGCDVTGVPITEMS